MRCKMRSCRYSGKASTYLQTTTCASNPGEARLFGIGWAGNGAVLMQRPHAPAQTGLADMAQYPDRGRDDVELFADDVADFSQDRTVMGAAALGLREFVDHVDAGERLGQGLASTWLPGVGGDGHRRTGFSRDNVRVRTPIHLRSLNRRIWSGEHCSLLAA